MRKSKILKDTYQALNKEMLEEEKKYLKHRWEGDYQEEMSRGFDKGMAQGINQARTILLNMMQQMYTNALEEEADAKTD